MPWFIVVAAGIATTARTASLAELVNDASAVVVVEVVATRSAWEGTRIVTFATLRVDESWVGDVAAGARVELVTLGGVVDGIGQDVAGAVRITPGERAVLCLEPAGMGRFRVVEMAQGAFFIRPGEASDPPLGRRSFGLHLIGTASRPHWPTTLRALERAVVELRREP
jgi:hypothetical protein